MHQNAEVEEQMAVHDVGKTMKNQLRFARGEAWAATLYA